MYGRAFRKFATQKGEIDMGWEWEGTNQIPRDTVLRDLIHPMPPITAWNTMDFLAHMSEASERSKQQREEKG